MAVALGVYVLNTAVQVVRLVYFRRTLRRRRRKALQGSSAASSGGSDTGGLTAGSLGSVDSGSTDEEEKGINYETAMAHTFNTGYVFVDVIVMYGWSHFLLLFPEYRALLLINVFWYVHPCPQCIGPRLAHH
jgi:hypothetical protein